MTDESKIHFWDMANLGACGAPVATSDAHWTDNWNRVTCAPCLAARPADRGVHFRHPLKWRTVCGKLPQEIYTSVSVADAWPEVTCGYCRVAKGGTPLAGSPERREQMIAECERVERECIEAEASLAETRGRAVALRHRLMRLSAREAAQNGPAAWLGTLGPYARSQRATGAWVNRPGLQRAVEEDRRAQFKPSPY